MLSFRGSDLGEAPWGTDRCDWSDPEGEGTPGAVMAALVLLAVAAPLLVALLLLGLAPWLLARIPGTTRVSDGAGRIDPGTAA